MRRAARVDANQGAIVAALRRIGCFVQSLAMVGQGCPDLLVGYRACWYVLEVKDGAKHASKQALTPDEREWHARAGCCAPVHVVNTVEQALAVVTQQ
ncbi:MAG: hypothetical protein ACXWVD_00010 [Telluria sp.]